MWANYNNFLVRRIHGWCRVFICDVCCFFSGNKWNCCIHWGVRMFVYHIGLLFFENECRNIYFIYLDIFLGLNLTLKVTPEVWLLGIATMLDMIIWDATRCNTDCLKIATGFGLRLQATCFKQIHINQWSIIFRHYLNDFDRSCMFVFSVEWISDAKFVILNLFISGSKTLTESLLNLLIRKELKYVGLIFVSWNFSDKFSKSVGVIKQEIHDTPLNSGF